MNGLLVVAPLRVEAALIASAARGVRVHRTGMGPRRSLAAAERLRTQPGRALIVLGFCGGLDAHSRSGEVIVAEEVLSAADEEHEQVQAACHDAERLAGALGDAGLTVRRGPIVGVGRIATGARRERLRAAGALAVDMESAWLAAGAAGRPFAVVRVVLDSPTHELFRVRAVGGALHAAQALRRAAAIALGVWGGEG